MDKIIVGISGISLIGFIYWFFFGKKDKIVSVGNNSAVDILVDGGYKPSRIKIKANQKTIVSILRKDPNSCLEEIIFPDFKIKKYLPLDERVNIEILPQIKGEYSFHCGMNMFRGKVVVE